MNAEDWFENLLRESENDPDFHTEELLLDITEQISLRMQELCIRSAELAQRLGVSRSYVSQLLGGKPNMTVRTLVRVAHVLDQRVQIELKSRDTIDRLDYRLYTEPIPPVVPESAHAIATAA